MSSHRFPALALGLAAGLAATLPAMANHEKGHDAEMAACATAMAHHHHLAVDGVYGPKTMAAVRKYQQVHALKVDGIAGPETLKSLGLPVTRTLRPGATGADVKAVQHAVSHHEHVWHGGAHPAAKPMAKPAAKPAAKPSPRPTTMWTPAPTPEPTAEPTTAPTPEPWTPAPTAAPAEPVSEGTWRPTIEVYGGDWMLPKTAGQLDYDYTFTKPQWFGGGALWLGSWGVGGEYTQIPNLYMGATQVLAAGAMYDAQLKWRCDNDMHHFGLGWRGFNGNNLGTLSYGLNLPLGTDVLRLHLGALGGSNFGPGWMADGRAGLNLNLGPIGLEGGYRVLGLNGFAGATTTVWTHAPYATVGLRF